MPDDRDRIAVVYICDQRYHALTEFSIASLVMLGEGPLTIYFFQVEYTQSPSPELERYVRQKGQQLVVQTLDRASMDSARLDAVALHPHISQVTLMKAYAIEIAAKNHDRLAFIDSDVLIFEPFALGTLFEFTSSLAGVYDFVSYMPFDGQHLIAHATATGVSADYMNAGVLLLHSDRWLEQDMLGRYLEKLEAHSNHCPYRHDEHGRDPGDCKGADQCALNMTFENDWTPLDFRWNVQKPIRHTAEWDKAALRHYTGHRKFLARSNVNRDWREARLLKRICRESGLKLPEPFLYDFGLLYLADMLKYFRTTQRYRSVLETLRRRMSDRAAA